MRQLQQMSPQYAIELYKVKGIPLLVFLNLKFQTVSFYNETFFPISGHFEKTIRCTEWPDNDLEQYKVKRTHVCVTHCIPENQISVCSALWPKFFELQAIIRQKALTKNLYDLDLKNELGSQKNGMKNGKFVTLLVFTQHCYCCTVLHSSITVGCRVSLSDTIQPIFSETADYSRTCLERPPHWP